MNLDLVRRDFIQKDCCKTEKGYGRRMRGYCNREDALTGVSASISQRGVNKANMNWVWGRGVKRWCDGGIDQRIFYRKASLFLREFVYWLKLRVSQSSETWGKESPNSNSNLTNKHLTKAVQLVIYKAKMGI